MQLKIFGMWLGTQEMPERYKPFLSSWRTCNPEADIQVLGNAEVASLMQDAPVRWQKKFASFDRIIEKCDFARYVLMYLHGGLYLDLNMMCHQTTAPLLRGRTILLAYEPKKQDRRIANCFLFSSAPQHQFWRTLLDDITDETQTDLPVLEATGPDRLTKVARSFFGTRLSTVIGNTHDILGGGFFTKDWSQTACWGQSWCYVRYKNYIISVTLMLLIFLLLLVHN